MRSRPRKRRPITAPPVAAARASGIVAGALTKPPLYVDLDGTLIRTDSMQQALLMLLRQRPLTALWAMAFVATHRVKVKHVVADLIELDPAHLPYREEVIEYVRRARHQGRRVVLATGSAVRYAGAVARHLGLFDEVFATEANGLNLISENKLAKIRADAMAHGQEQFEYLGDSHADVVIFRQSAIAGWVGGRRLNVAAGDSTHVHRLAHVENNRWSDLLHVLRPTWWLVPPALGVLLLIARVPLSWTAWWPTLALSLALSFALGAGFVLSDLLNMAADQRTPGGRSRPIASGAVTVPRAVQIGLLLFGLAILFGLAYDVRTPVMILVVVLFVCFFNRSTRAARAGPIKADKDAHA